MSAIGCNENQLDSSCVCQPRYGSGSLYRILELQSGEYTCCGQVEYDGSYNKQGGICQGWDSDSLDSNRIYAPAGYGPDPALATAAGSQAVLAQSFPLPMVTSNSYTCPVGWVPRYVEYPNPNGGSKYVNTVGCIPYAAGSYVTTTPAYTSNDFALYLIKGCDVDPALSSNVCIPTNPAGSTSNIGSQSFKSSSYKGPNNAGTGGSGTSSTIWGIPTWLFWTLVVILVLVIIGIIILIAISATKKSTNTVTVTPMPTTTTNSPAIVVSR